MEPLVIVGDPLEAGEPEVFQVSRVEPQTRKRRYMYFQFDPSQATDLMGLLHVNHALYVSSLHEHALF